MSREGGKPVPMTAMRRTTLLDALQSALEYDAGFTHERIVVTCVRIDGRFSELVGVVEAVSPTSIIVHRGHDGTATSVPLDEVKP